MFNQFLSSTYSSILSYRKLFMYNGSGNSCEKNLCNNIFFSARILNAHKINCKLWFDVLITLTHSIGTDCYMYFIILWNFFYHSTLKYSYIRLLKSKSYPEVGSIQYIILPFYSILWKHVLIWHDPITLSIKGYKRGQRMSS